MVSACAKRLRDSDRQHANVNFVFSDLYCLPLRRSVADVVICSHILEHLNFPDLVLASIRSMLRDKGVLIVSVPTILWELQLLLRRAKSMLFGLRPSDFSQLFHNPHIHKWPPWKWEMLVEGLNSAFRFLEVTTFFPSEGRIVIYLSSSILRIYCLTSSLGSTWGLV